nr:alpha/beta hydrolase [Anaerolineae bacterium]
MATFTVNGHTLYYAVRGNLKHLPLVWLHHGLGSSADWDNPVSRFSDRYYSLAVDRWGYGKSDPREAFDTGFMEADAHELCALLDHLRIRDVLLIGHSDGGTVALLAAARRPDLIRAIVVEAAHIYYEPKMAEGIRRLKDKIATGARVQAALEAAHGSKWQALCDNWISYWLDSLEIGAALILPEALNTIRQPVLVVQGTEDQFATMKHAQDIADRLRQSELWLIPNARHSPHSELPNLFTEQVQRFFMSQRQDRQ